MSPDQEILKILDLVAEKKISAEEGAELIAALDRQGGPDRDENQDASTAESGHEERAGGSDRPRGYWRRFARRQARSGAGIGDMVDSIVDGVMKEVFQELGGGFHEDEEGSPQADRPTDQRFDLADGADRTMALSIELFSCSLALLPAAEPDVVHFSYRGPELLKPTVSFEHHRLRIHQPRRGLHFRIDRGIDVPRVEVRVPKGVVLTGSAELMNGLFSMEGLSARDLDVESMNGAFKVSARSLSDCSFETRNGAMEVVAEEAQSISMEAVNGKLSLAGVLKGASLETVNGRIFVEAFPGSQGDLSAETARGALTVRIPKAIGYALEAEAGVGSIHLDVHGSLRHDSRGKVGREVSMAHGDEALRIHLETAVGSIQVEDGRA